MEFENLLFQFEISTENKLCIKTWHVYNISKYAIVCKIIVSSFYSNESFKKTVRLVKVD